MCLLVPHYHIIIVSSYVSRPLVPFSASVVAMANIDASVFDGCSDILADVIIAMSLYTRRLARRLLLIFNCHVGGIERLFLLTSQMPAPSRHGHRTRLSLGGCLLLEHRPVKDVVVLVAERAEQDAEQLTQVHVVGSLVEAQTTTVVEVHGKLGRESLAQHLDRCRHLLLADLLVLLFLGDRLETLPREAATVEVHQYVAERFHVVSPALFDAEVRVYAGVASGSGQVFVLAVQDVCVRSTVPVFLRETKVDEKQFVAMAPDAHEEIVRFYVAMYEVFVVYELDTSDHLVGHHQHGFHGESPRTKVEQIFQTGPQ